MSAYNTGPSARAVLARSIRTLRRRKGMTQEDLSEATGITRSHISALEHGRSNVRLDSLDRIAAALGVPVSQLFDDRPGGGTRGDRRRLPRVREPSSAYRAPVGASPGRPGVP